MGVPVLALAGGNFVGRMGASFMRTLGHPEWVAQDEDGYVAAAVALAAHYQTLRGQRGALREQMAASALCDIKTYVTEFEALLQTMWARHCAGDSRRLIEAKA
jgi:predicted O-linked N-acetylglucosamine transferase (SPINDLY family)